MSEKPKITNLTEMSLNKAILTMALPASGIMLLESLYQFVDSFWIGKLGQIPLAAVSACTFLLWMFFSFGDIGNIAGSALTARAIGAGDEHKIQDYFRQCMVVNFVTSVILMIVILFIMDHIFVILGLEPDVVSQAGEYFMPWVLSLPIILLAMLMSAVFRGSGDTKTPMYLSIVLVVINAILDPVFIFGFGPIPAMGVSGAAWVSVVNHFVFVGLGYHILNKRQLWPKWLGLRSFMMSKEHLLQIVKMGLPMALNGALFSLTYVGLTWVIAHFGSASVAAIGMGHRLESFPWFVSYGFSVAAASVVGQFLGANKPKVAEWAVWKTAMLAGLVISIFVVAMWFWVEPVVRFFIDDSAVVFEASRYVRIASVCWLVGVLEVVCEGGFSGAGHTLPTMLIGVPLTVARIPVAYFMAITLDMGIIGVWYAIGGTMIAKGLLMAYWFRRGGWKTSKVS